MHSAPLGCWARRVAVMLVTALAISACGGGGDSAGNSTAPDASADSSTTTTDETTTTTEAPAVEPVPESVAATPMLEDLGESWTIWQDEVIGGEEGSGHNRCHNSAGNLNGVGPEKVSESELFQFADATYFVQSQSWVFDDEAAATAFAEHLLSDAFASCRQDELASNSDEIVVSDAVIERGEDAEGQLGTVAYNLQFEDETGALVDAGSNQLHSILRSGSTVVSLFIQQQSSPEDPPGIQEQFAEEINTGVNSMWSRIS